MFRLQKLEITGFKSFADYTQIVFTGEGITAVVGPNGCGKSNVSEAIAWVLGEQSAKNLRGGEMRDVIFQGAKNRQPSGMAEVVLHLVRDETAAPAHDEIDEIDEALAEFDAKSRHVETFQEIHAETLLENGSQLHENKAKAASATNGNITGYSYTQDEPKSFAEVEISTANLVSKTSHKRNWRPSRLALDFAPNEVVTITRRLYRSADSEYLLNGKTCRLRDIQDLFSGTGLSGSSYAIIEQGRIGQILSAKPSDRRALIEEAAGITKFRTRQRAAELRLESAKTNLRRLSDIVGEIEKQANSLRRQASKTRRYKVLREELRELLRQVFTADGIELTVNLRKLQDEIAFVTKNEQNALREVEESEKAFRQATEEAREAEENLTNLRETIAENNLNRDRRQGDFQYKTEQSRSSKERLHNLQNEIRHGENRLSNLSTDVERLREKNLAAQNTNNDNDAELKTAEENYQKKIAEVRALELNSEKIRNALLQHSTAVERFREISRQLENALEKLGEQASGLRRESERAAQTHTENLEKHQVTEIETKICRDKLNETTQLKQNKLQTQKTNRETLQTAEKSWQKVREECSRNKHRLETLQEVEAKKTLYAPAVQKLIAAQDKLEIKFNGTLADKLRVVAEVEPAVEAVFGEYLQTIIVNSAEAVQKVSAWLETNKIGRVNLIVFSEKENSVLSKTVNESVKIADLIETTESFRAFLAETFPAQMQTRIVENLEAAVKLKDENCVTKTGEIIAKARFFAIGRVSANTQNNSLLAFKRELRELETHSVELKTNLETAENEVKTARQNVETAEKEIAEINAKISSDERALMSLELNIKSLEQEIERAKRHLRVVADEKKRLETETKDVEHRRIKAAEDMQIAETERVAAAGELNKLSEELAKKRNQAETENTKLSRQRAEVAAANERRRSLFNALKRSEAEEIELKTLLATRQSDFEAVKKQLSELRLELTDLEKLIVTSVDTKLSENEELLEASVNLKFLREKSDTFSAKLNESHKLSAKIRETRATLEIKQAETQTRLENLHTICSQELNITLPTLLQTQTLAADFELSENRMRLEDLREKLDNFGAVNMLALEELSESEERLLFLTGQKKDIVDSIFSAEEALGEIKNRSRERFQDAFEVINRNFSEFFGSIFGGGKGEMNLLEAGDILEAGIEIIAQPPGKRLQNILLLSGGEKAMTAIALVLAIFKYRPSPFCLLDEVDAPLDEANVGRFVQQIEEMSGNTQFIVITHNKRTMEAARALYGVTMEEAGISRVVSVKFE